MAILQEQKEYVSIMGIAIPVDRLPSGIYSASVASQDGRDRQIVARSVEGLQERLNVLEGML